MLQSATALHTFAAALAAGMERGRAPLRVGLDRALPASGGPAGHLQSSFVTGHALSQPVPGWSHKGIARHDARHSPATTLARHARLPPTLRCVGEPCEQYISGRFATGYRATIGADFITKSVPHHSSPDETVTLQLWDTAGQERFSSLSSAFFRGADAAILLFDANKSEMLQSLVRWWADFREKAPVPDEDLQDFCCVVVGNKIDLARDTPPVSEADVEHLIDELVPPPSPPLAPILSVAPIPETDTDEDAMTTPIAAPGTPPSKSIDITARRPRRSLRSVSRSRSRSTVFRGGTVGTMTATRTIYHTPSRSVFDLFESALSSPAHTTISMLARSASPPSSSTVSSAGLDRALHASGGPAGHLQSSFAPQDPSSRASAALPRCAAESGTPAAIIIPKLHDQLHGSLSLAEPLSSCAQSCCCDEALRRVAQHAMGLATHICSGKRAQQVVQRLGVFKTPSSPGSGSWNVEGAIVASGVGHSLGLDAHNVLSASQLRASVIVAHSHA
ncbi:ras family-domain-containing protein [Rhodofomes roseus]|uniref:Ras family-domain-containing protein n=1 Tax=Rhodofomes roseus TaxID=34475 RepID=A0ABQ8KQ97_9APHY|nr:ras family-domain-containing protein [Rhodofomes roseus]KAH9840803.1 ras family-domain-containing protein [Rhodofomes roseus]